MEIEKYSKVTVGFVTQIFVKQGDGRFACTEQNFEAAGGDDRELDDLDHTLIMDGEGFNSADEIYECYHMVQPNTELDYYYLFVWKGVEPELMGPFDTKEAMHEAVIIKRKKEGDEHGYYAVQCCKESKLVIDSWSGGFFEEG